MRKLAITIMTFIISNSLMATGIELHSENYIPTDIKKIEVILNKVALAPYLNDHNTFYLGDNNFEMFLSLNGNRLIEFPLKSNISNKEKKVELKHRLVIDIKALNYAVDRRKDAKNLTDNDKRFLRKSRTGQICMLDDSFISPEFLTTSYYGCFDIVNEVQKMIEYNSLRKEIYIEKNTTFPLSNDPKKAKLFKSWYTIKITK